MKSLLRLLVVIGFLLPLPLAAVTGGGGEKGEFSEEQKSDTPAPEIKIFTRRYLKLRNATSEKVSAQIIYRTYMNDAWVWQPADPGMGDTLSVEIEPNQTIQVMVGDQPITASRIRIWGSSRSFKWDNNRENDLWTVPEIDMKEHRYSATEMDTFAYTFSAPDGADRGVGEPTDTTTNDPKENKGDPLPPDATTPPPTFQPNEGETNIFGNNSAIAGGDNTPIAPGGGFDGGFPGGGASGGISDAGAGGVGGGGVPLPGGLGGLLDKFLGKDKDGKDKLTGTDLAATNFKLTATGDFTGTVENLGAEEFTGGREWFVLKSKTGKAKGFDKALAKGTIDPIPAGGKFDVKGKIPGFTTTAFYVLVISPGDPNKKNDSSNVQQFTPSSSKSDLSVTLTLKGGVLEGIIKNEGPEDYKEGSRTFKLGEKTGTVSPKEGKVPDLKKGETFKIASAKDIKSALKLDTKFFLTLNAGDEKPDNDFAEVVNKGKGSGPDLEAKDLVFIGDILEGTIVNNGPGDYKGGRTFFLGNKEANKSDAITELKQGATRKVSLSIPKDVLAKPQTFKLNISEIDAKPGNDSVSLSNKTANPSDLAATLKLEGTTIKGKITNTGKTIYDGKSRTFKLFHDKQTYQQGTILKKLNPGESFDVTQALPKNAPAQTIVLEISKGDGKTGNDKAEVKFLATKVDLSVKMSITGSTAKVIVTNVSPDKYEGKRTFTFKADGLPDINGDVLAPIQPNNFRTITFDLVKMSKPGNVTFSLVNTDPNPGNDSATVFFKAASKGFDLRVDKAAFSKGEFVLSVTNTGLTPYAGGDPYLITGPGFKEIGKIPAIANGKSLTFVHKVKTTPVLPVGTYQFILNVKDTDVKDNTFTFKIGTTLFDLRVDKAEFAKGVFAFNVTNEGIAPYPGGDTYTITGPGGFKDTDKIPAIANGKSATFTHKPKATPPNGSYQIVLNVKDTDPKDNNFVFNVAVPVKGVDLAANGLNYNEKTQLFTFEVTNKGTAAYTGKNDTTITGPGFKEAGPTIPDLAAGASIKLSHKFTGKFGIGTYTVTLNVKDADPKNQTSSFTKLVKGLDLFVSNFTYNAKTNVFAFKITNQGTSAFNDKSDATITGPGGFKETVPLPKLEDRDATASHKAIAKVLPGTYTVTLNVKDADPTNNTATVKVGTAIKGVDLAVSNFTYNPTTHVFAFKIKNQGTADFADNASATITGPGGFKETIPTLPSTDSGNTSTVSHKALGKVAPGTYTVTLNVKDADATNQTASIKVVELKSVDLAVSNFTFNAKTQVFAFKVTNQGGAAYLGMQEATITGPGGFKEAGATIPDLAAGASTTLSHKAMAKVVPGTYTVTLNVKDADPTNQTATVKVAPSVGGLKAELIIAGMAKKGGNWTVTIQNIGAGAYSNADGAKFSSRYVKKGASTKLNPDVAVPNIPAGGSVTLNRGPEPGMGYSIEGFLSGPSVSSDPAKTKATIK